MAKVLLVEDDNNLREIYEARLQAEGYDTATASDGEQALVVAKQARPDLVISDVMMPKISGFEMLDILRNTDGLKDVKVIMLTALGQSEDKARADQLGADRYLVKSQVTLEDIVKTAHQLLDDVEAPVPAVAATAAVAAEPTVAPVAVAAVPTGPVVNAIPTDAPAAAVSTAEETQVMQAQIDEFVAQPAITPSAVDLATMPEPVQAVPASPAEPAPLAPVLAAPVLEPAETDAPPVALDAATTHDDQVMATAVDSLASATSTQKPSDVTAVEVAPPSPATAEVATPAPVADPAVAVPDSADDGVTVGHKKVIQPLNDPANAKPDLDALLAADEAEEIAASAPQFVQAPAPAEVAVDPTLQVAPELEAALTQAVQPALEAPLPSTLPNPVTITEPPVDPSKPNPNDISL